MDLRENGVGQVVDLPVWDGEGSCRQTGTYSGSIRWRTGDGAAIIDLPTGPVYFWADTQLGGLNWDKLVVGICGRATPEKALVIYDGAPHQRPSE